MFLIEIGSFRRKPNDILLLHVYIYLFNWIISAILVPVIAIVWIAGRTVHLWASLTACMICFLTLPLNMLLWENMDPIELQRQCLVMSWCVMCGSSEFMLVRWKPNLLWGIISLCKHESLYSIVLKIILAIAAEGESKFMLNSYILVFPILFIDFNMCVVIDCSSSI